MNKYITKDHLKRVLSFKVEKEKLFYKYLFFNFSFDKKVRNIAYKIFDFHSTRFNQRGKIKLRCIKTGRSRSNISEFGLSRISFRVLASEGLLPGLRKSSW